MIFHTLSGSTYEVDHENKRCRRVEGKPNADMPRMGPDGEWREYKQISGILRGCPVLIEWNMDCVPPPAPGLRPGTQTSPVISLLPEDYRDV